MYERRINYKETINMRSRKKYGLFSFLFDVILTFVTGGLWLIWVFVREMRNR